MYYCLGQTQEQLCNQRARKRRACQLSLATTLAYCAYIAPTRKFWADKKGLARQLTL
jgi:capsule polysaccharide export protein KpsC/LpsZ